MKSVLQPRNLNVPARPRNGVSMKSVLQPRNLNVSARPQNEGIEFQSKITEYIRSIRRIFAFVRSEEKRITPQYLLTLCNDFNVGSIIGVFPKHISAIRLVLQNIPNLSASTIQIILDCLHCQTDFEISQANAVQCADSGYSNSELQGRQCRMFQLEDGFEDRGGNWSRREAHVHNLNSGKFHCPYLTSNIEEMDISKLPDSTDLTPFLKNVGVAFGLSEKFKIENMDDCHMSFLYNFTKKKMVRATIIFCFPYYDQKSETIGAISIQKMIKVPRNASVEQIAQYLAIVKNTFTPVGEKYIVKSMQE